MHLSKDKVLVVIHDETVDRTTIGKGFVSNFTSLELEKFGIPTLEQVFILVKKRCFINIEIKDSKATIEVVELIEKYILKENWDIDLFQISSFNWKILQLIYKLNPNLNLGILTESSVEDAVFFGKKVNANSINPYFKLLNPENIKLVYQNKFKIYTWTVNSLEDITFVKSLNIDGIISDFPDRL